MKKKGRLLLLISLTLTTAILVGYYLTTKLMPGEEEVVLQSTPYNCGPAALATICRMWGREVSQEEIAKLAGTDSTGTTMLGLAQAAEALGLKATGLKLNFRELKEIKKPLIAFINKKHYVVVKEINEERLILLDPKEGRTSVPTKDFIKIWDGYVLVLEEVSEKR